MSETLILILRLPLQKMRQKRDRLSQWKADAKKELAELKGSLDAASTGSVASEDWVATQEMASVQDSAVSLPSHCRSYCITTSPLQ